MFGLRNKSVIFKMRRPETRIGRHNTNHVTLTKSLKVSRFHAVVNFLNETPLIKDISEWGVYLNGTLIGKNRWAELKLGDILALGTLKIENGGHLLEVVSWEPEDKTLISHPKIEVVDITKDDDEVITISDEEERNVPKKACATSQVLQSTSYHATERKPLIDITVISDDEDETELPTLPCEPKQISSSGVVKIDSTSPMEENIVPSDETKFADCTQINIDATTRIDELPLANENIVSSNEIKFIDCASIVDEVPLIDENIDPPPNKVKFIDCAPTMNSKFVDVTPTMNGLLLQTSPNLPDLAVLPQTFQSIFDYSSDDENSLDLVIHDQSKFDERGGEFYSSATISTDETKAIPQAQVKKGFEDGYGYKSPLGVFSEYYKENGCNNAESSDSTETSEKAPIKTKAPIIHRTLLTNKIAKIVVISPLPNKSAIKRKGRVRSESPNSVYQHVVNADAEHKTKSPKSKGRPHKSQKASNSALEQPTNVENSSRNKAAKKDLMKEAREKVKALYNGLPARPERDPSTRPQSKIKVTDKNKDDFLTKLKPVPVLRNPGKPHNKPKVDDNVTSNQSVSESLEEPKTECVFSNEVTRFMPKQKVLQIESEPKSSPSSSYESVRSINEILDNSKVIGGGCIVKRSHKAQLSTKKKRVRFPSEIATSSEEPKKKCLGPPNCFDYSENCLSTKLSQRQQESVKCYNCFKHGHAARECKRPIMCYNCYKFGHKCSKCSLLDIRKATQCPFPYVRNLKQISRDPRIRNKILSKRLRWNE